MPSFVKFTFLILFIPIAASAYTGETGYIEPSLSADSNIQFFSGYETYDGADDSTWKPAWGMEFESNPEHHSITSSDVLFGNYSARVIYPAGTFSSPGGTQHLNDFSLFPTAITPRESMYARYYVRFDPDFEFVKGGKLPGLCGGECNTGGDKPDGTDGWSARIMWRGNGKIVQYLYHPDQPTTYGEDLSWNYGGCDRYFIPGKWHCVETYIQMNTPGDYDGVVRSWLDGELALERTDIRFRNAGYSNIQIDHFYFSTFFGGGDSSWAPSKDEHSQFDNFIISDAYVGECSDCTIPPPPTPEPTPVMTVVSEKLIFDSDNPGWSGLSWGSTTNFDDSAQNYTTGGSESASIQYSAGSWGAAGWDAGGESPFDLNPYTHIDMRVYPTDCNVMYRVALRNPSGTDMVQHVVSGSPVYFPLTGSWDVNNWNFIRIPIEDFGLSTSELANVDRILLKSDDDLGGPLFYVDDVKIVELTPGEQFTPTSTLTPTQTLNPAFTPTITNTVTHTPVMPNRVYACGNQPIFAQGINAAWNNFGNDFGTQPLDTAYFETMFSEIEAAHGNTLRMWIHVNGSNSPVFDGSNMCSGNAAYTISNIEEMLDIARSHGVTVIMSLWSFDMMQSQTGVVAQNSINLVTTDTGINAYINNSLIPILNAVGDHPAVLCWEICNEPEGMSDEFGWTTLGTFSMADIQKWHNRLAGAIRRNCNKPITTGAWSFQSLCDYYGGDSKNYWSDSELIAAGGDTDGYFDFYQVHYYDNWGPPGTTHSPFHHPASYWGLDKAILVGEFSAKGYDNNISVTPIECYNLLYDNGYAGAVSWTYTGHDGHGDLTDAEPGLTDIWNQHPDDIYWDTDCNFTPTATATLTDTPNPLWTKTSTPTATNTQLPTHKLNLQVRNNGDDPCGASIQDYNYDFKIINNDTVPVDTSSLSIKAFFNTSDSIVPQGFYGGSVRDSGGGWVATIGSGDMSLNAENLPSPACGSGDRMANRTVTFSFTGSYSIPANGGYAESLDGNISRGSYLSPMDDNCDDYSKLGTTAYHEDIHFLLYENGILVCEYTDASTQDADSGVDPCTGLSACGGGPAPTNTQTIAATPSFTPTNSQVPTESFTPTYTSTSSVLPSATSTYTSTGTQVATSSFTPSFTPTNSQVPTDSFTPTGTSTATCTSTFTDTVTSTPTSTFTLSTFTYTATSTPTVTSSVSSTFTVTVTNTATATFTSTDSPVLSPTPTYTGSPPTLTDTPTITQTFTFTGTGTITRTHTETASPTGTFTQTATNSRQPTMSFTPTFTSTGSITLTVTSSVSKTATPTSTDSQVATHSFTPTYTSTGTQVPTSSFTATYSDTETATPTGTFSATVTNTATATFTSTDSPVLSPTPTYTGSPPTLTDTPTITQTFTFTGTGTVTRTHTETASPTGTFTQTATSSRQPTMSFTPTPTSTNSQAATSSYTPTYTSTSSQIPTNSFTPTFTGTGTQVPTHSFTPTVTFTYTPTPTITFTQTPTGSEQPTSTLTPAPAESDELVIDKTLPYPNPYNPDTGAPLNLGFNITQNVPEVTFKLYTSASRLVRVATIPGPFSAGRQRAEIKPFYLTGLSKGIYFYVITAKDKEGAGKRSVKIGKIIIIR